MKKCHLFFALILFSLVTSCGFDLHGHYTDDLTHGYQIACIGRNNNNILGSNYLNTNIIAFGYNDDYILAKQEPDRYDFLWTLRGDIVCRYQVYCKVLNNFPFSYPVADIIAGSDHDIANYIGKQWNYKFIDDSIIYQYLKTRGISPNFKYSNKENSIVDALADSIMDNHPTYKKIFSNKYIFWIITLKDDQLIGPLTEDEYLIKREELKIPQKLKLDQHTD